MQIVLDYWISKGPRCIYKSILVNAHSLTFLFQIEITIPLDDKPIKNDMFPYSYDLITVHDLYLLEILSGVKLVINTKFYPWVALFEVQVNI